MKLKILQIGSSYGVVIPKGALDLLKLNKGDVVEVDLKKVKDSKQ